MIERAKAAPDGSLVPVTEGNLTQWKKLLDSSVKQIMTRNFFNKVNLNPTKTTVLVQLLFRVLSSWKGKDYRKKVSESAFQAALISLFSNTPFL